MSIVIPDGIEDIYRRIIDKCVKLIDLKYWDGVEKEKLLAWVRKFKTDDEMFLASAILNTLIYRSKGAVESFGANIFHIILPQILSNEGIYEVTSLDEWEEKLKKKSCLQFPFRFTTIEGVDSSPAKSGSVIYRTLQRKYFDKSIGINNLNIQSIDSSIKAIILFDDMLGTSEQFTTFIEKYELNKLPIKIIYIPLTAHQSGIDLVKQKYKDIIIHPVETLDERNSFFSLNNRFLYGKNASSVEEMEVLYKDFCIRNKIKMKNLIGYGDMALTYCFYDSTPNNNLALLWYSSDTWPELFTR